MLEIYLMIGKMLAITLGVCFLNVFLYRLFLFTVIIAKGNEIYAGSDSLRKALFTITPWPIDILCFSIMGVCLVVPMFILWPLVLISTIAVLIYKKHQQDVQHKRLIARLATINRKQLIVRNYSRY